MIDKVKVEVSDGDSLQIVYDELYRAGAEAFAPELKEQREMADLAYGEIIVTNCVIELNQEIVAGKASNQGWKGRMTLVIG